MIENVAYNNFCVSVNNYKILINKLKEIAHSHGHGYRVPHFLLYKGLTTLSVDDFEDISLLNKSTIAIEQQCDFIRDEMCFLDYSDEMSYLGST